MTALAITISVALLAALSSPFLYWFPQTANPAPINDAQARAELTAVLAERDRAAEKEDIDQFLSFYSPEFVWRFDGGKTLTRKSWEELIRLKSEDQTLEHKQQTTIQSLKLRGPEAVLEVESNSFVKQKLKDGSIKESVEGGHRRETWIRTDQGWKLKLIDKAKDKSLQVTVNGQKVDPHKARSTPLVPPPNPEDKAVLQDFALVFFYRLKDGTIVKTPVYCDDVKLAEITGGSFFKAKIMPGKHACKSEKGGAIEINVEQGKIYFLVVKLTAGFPKGRGLLEVDSNNTGTAAYKLPHLLDLRPLGSDNISNKSIVIVERQ